MKKIIFLAILCVNWTINAQVLDPVDWETSVEKISDSEYDLVASSTIDPGWHLYSQDVPEDGPIATLFTFEENTGYELVGSVAEEEGVTINDPVFQMRIKFFEDKAEFRQRIKVVTESLSLVKGEVEFMVCDDSRCILDKNNIQTLDEFEEEV